MVCSEEEVLEFLTGVCITFCNGNYKLGRGVSDLGSVELETPELLTGLLLTIRKVCVYGGSKRPFTNIGVPPTRHLSWH